MTNFRFDSELLAVKFTLIDYLTDKGFAYFQDFLDVETDLSESSMSVMINCEITKIAPVIDSFCQKYRFWVAGFDDSTGRLIMFREGKSPQSVSF